MRSSTFPNAFAIIVGHEGGYDNDPEDPGNWTGGAAGSGELRGTKFGISAAAYPSLVIAELSLDDARAIYRRDYWDRVQADLLPAPLALLVFDAAVNNGVSRAIIWLQQAVGAEPDGDLGPETRAATDAAVKDNGAVAVCTEFQARRLIFMAALPTWSTFGLGWARRLCSLPYQSLSMTGT